ncbi:MAG: homocysteine S-methyltransferase family protein [Acidobacteriota bacterium]
MHSVIARLRRGEVVVGDGAWGTLLMARCEELGAPLRGAPERLNLERPELLTEIARRYRDAGAEVLTTNTFGASPARLRLHGLEERLEEICAGAVEALRAAVGDEIAIAGSVGPTGRLLRPLGDLDPAEAEAGFARQIEALARAGADLVCVETMSDLDEATLAVRAARKVAPRLGVLATMTFEPTPRGYFTVMGVSVERAAAGLAAAGADVVGSNCGNGIAAMVEIAREFARSTNLPIAIQANAGLPESRGGMLLYPETPDDVAARVPDLLAAGARYLGGCCGTTPEHIRALVRAVEKSQSG